MESHEKQIRDMLEPKLTAAIDGRNDDAAIVCIEQLAQTESFTADWAEAIGTRLQIRDLLVGQKGVAASVEPTAGADIEKLVVDYIKQFDAGLDDVSGQSHGNRLETPRETLKQNRMARLARAMRELKPQYSMDMLHYFAAQPTTTLLRADDLVGIMVGIRSDIVNDLWSAAQTYREGNEPTAVIELRQGLESANEIFDDSLQHVLHWNDQAV